MHTSFRTVFRFCLALAAASASAADSLLIFTRTAGVRENNISDTRSALKAFYETKGLAVDLSENGAQISDTGLAHYRAIVFLKTTGDFLNDAQQAAFEKWFQAGGAVQIIHAALDAETNWPFYGKLIGGAWFKSLPGDSTTRHTIVVEDTADRADRDLPRRWERTDEIYGFRSNPRAARDPQMHILATVDESTFRNGTAGADHPMSWYCAYQGGRAWTTAMGHVTAAYHDSLFLGHLWGGMQYLLDLPVVGLRASSRPSPGRAGPGPGNRASVRVYGPESDRDARGRVAGDVRFRNR